MIEPGMIVDPEKDSVIVDGKPFFLKPGRYIYFLIKPRGYIVTAKDTQGRPTVFITYWPGSLCGYCYPCWQAPI